MATPLSLPTLRTRPGRSRMSWLLVACVLLWARPSSAHDEPSLAFFKNYFVTGDYVVGGVSLRGTGVNGLATGNISISGVPATADILAAFLYWQTVTTAVHGSGTTGAQFRGHDISTLAKALNPSGTAPCWSSGGATGASGGAHKMISYRADVLRFLDPDPVTGKLQANTTHQVLLPDSGSTGNGVPSTGGATLVVVYRDPAQPQRAVVIYDGGQTVDRSTRGLTLSLAGFYQASFGTPVAKVTPIVGEGQAKFSERLYFNSQLIAVNPFVAGWENPSFDVSGAVAGGASKGTISVQPAGNSLDCLSWSALVFSTTVQDADRDGLLDIWESSTATLYDPLGRALPNLRAMGADPSVQDIFVEAGYMTTAGYTNPAQGFVESHSHLPTKAALDMVASAFRGAAPRPSNPGPINIHFDVGANYQWPTVNPATGFPYPALPTLAQCKTNWQPSCAIIPANLARGGESLTEVACVPRPGVTCRFPDYPGTVGWKSAYRFYRDQPLNYPSEQACVAAGSACTRRFDVNRKDMFHYALFAHAVGLPRSDVDDPDTSFDERATPKNTSGIADPPGGDLMVTLGFWDNFVGSDFMQASTLMHELGHNLLLRHGGPPLVLASGAMKLQDNCRPNYQSIMNYLFQVRGMLTASGTPVIDYSRQALGALDEHGLVEFAGMGPLVYRARWYAPWASSFIDSALSTTPPTRHCDGSKLGPADMLMARIDGTNVPTALSPAIDWNADGVISGVVAADANFSGIVDGQPLTPLSAGASDFQTMDLRQVGGRRNSGSQRIGGAMSLDMGFADVGFADVGFGDVGFGDVGFGDVGFADVGFGDVGFADVGFGDVGFGDVGVGNDGAPVGDLDYETATALGNAPAALSGGPGPVGNTLSWAQPHVRTVLSYEIYRVNGSTVTPGNFAARVLVAIVPGLDTTFVDVYNRPLNPGGPPGTSATATYTYFVLANLDDGTRSTVSNFVTIGP